ncbi:unnamed protein product [Amaranthus hypochondriacus]
MVKGVQSSCKIKANIAMQTPNMLVVFSLLISLILPFNTQAFNQSNKFNSQISATDPFKFLGIVLNPDGSLTRSRNPTVPPNTTSSLAFSKDIPFNPKKKTWIRVYLPNNTKPRSGKLPIIIFSHGGGFIVGSAAAPDVDSFLSISASQLSMLIVSVEYRLAPEHRLPAAYNDVVEALYWVKEKKDNWVKKYGDITNCIIMGESAGGNIAYTIGVKASHFAKKLVPMEIKGMVLIQPFFDQINRTESELTARGALPLEVTDLMWNFSLPRGANRNHPYSNPSIYGFSKWDKIKKLCWKVAFLACDGDGLFDKQVEVFTLMKKYGVNVIGNFDEGGYHGLYIHETIQFQKIFKLIRIILSSHTLY